MATIPISTMHADAAAYTAVDAAEADRHGAWAANATGPALLAAQATRLAVNCHSCVNAAAQYAGLAALSPNMIRACEGVFLWTLALVSTGLCE